MGKGLSRSYASSIRPKNTPAQPLTDGTALVTVIGHRQIVKPAFGGIGDPAIYMQARESLQRLNHFYSCVTVGTVPVILRRRERKGRYW